MITSRSSGRWIIPKGMIDPGHTPEEAAAQEALEEAGVRGHLEESVGRYRYTRWASTMEVEVFPLRVHDELPSWLEEDFRTRRWFPARRAVREVQQPGLARLLEQFVSERS